MNRAEVIMTIKTAGSRFAGVMASLCGEEYAAGYKRAISDMTNLFAQAPIDADFEAERAALCAEIKRLKMENDMLNRDCAKQHETIEELLKHVDIHEVLGINKQERQDPRRVAFWVK